MWHLTCDKKNTTGKNTELILKTLNRSEKKKEKRQNGQPVE